MPSLVPIGFGSCHITLPSHMKPFLTVGRRSQMWRERVSYGWHSLSIIILHYEGMEGGGVRVEERERERETEIDQGFRITQLGRC
jgi:hypothetical protein